MIITLDLQPIRTGTSTITPGQVYYEQVLVRLNDYPAALLHIDTFYTSDGNEIYDRLNVGERVTVNAEFTLKDSR